MLAEKSVIIPIGFRVGCRVRMSEYGIKQGLHPRTARTGKVVRMRGEYVSVLRDGKKKADAYHVDFWENSKNNRRKVGVA
jgi:hypothetical protein